MTFIPGETVGPYQILAQIGQGGMEKFPEAKLLSAEIQIQNKEKEAAKRSLKDLAADSTLPAWVTQKASEMLNLVQ